jgi:hypothetical protein
MFIKYQHVERYGNTEVQGIELGEAYVFPKLDGTNGSVWMDDGVICAGSRNRVLAIGDDNAGFYGEISKDIRIASYLKEFPHHTLYGEWLVPHSLKTYREDAWRKFYIFDVFDRNTEKLMHYEGYRMQMERHGLNYLAPLAIIKNGSADMFVQMLEKNVFLIQDGMGSGEGIVIKNYDYLNRFGNQIWAKLVTNEFKEKHHKEMGAPIIGCEIIEQKITDKYVTQALVDKVYAKIAAEHDGWTSRYIPQLLNTVFYDLVREEMWEIIKEHKNPRIDFRALHMFTVGKIKTLRLDLF